MNQQEYTEAYKSSRERVFDLAVLAGEILLESGAEIERVDDTMKRIAQAFELENFDVYVLTSGLFASADGDEYKLNSRIKGVPSASPHFGRIDGVNDISRNLVTHRYTVDEAFCKMEEIRTMPVFPAIYHTLGAGVGAMSFCYLLGGTGKDSVFSFLVGFLMWSMVYHLRKWGMKRTLCNVLGSAVACSLSIYFYSLGFGDSVDKMIIGSLIPLIPGVSFVNGIRDFSDNNFLSGIVRLLDVAVVTTCMAIGSGIVIEFVSKLGGAL